MTLNDCFYFCLLCFLNMCLHHFTKKTLKKENQEHGVHTKFRGYSISESGLRLRDGTGRGQGLANSDWAGASQGPPVRVGSVP